MSTRRCLATGALIHPLLAAAALAPLIELHLDAHRPQPCPDGLELGRNRPDADGGRDRAAGAREIVEVVELDPDVRLLECPVPSTRDVASGNEDVRVVPEDVDFSWVYDRDARLAFEDAAGAFRSPAPLDRLHAVGV